MEYTKLGNSDLQVSRICLGCMGFGIASQGQHSWTLDEEKSKEIIKYALDNGINFFDTAMGYQNGTSEEFLGRAIKEYAKRENVVIATKFLPRTEEEIENKISGQQHVLNCLNASLQRLGMEYVDLYICHMWDYHTPIEDILEGLHIAYQQGKIKAIGISNCYAWQLAKANAIARSKGYLEFVSIQGHYNLLFREEEREMVPLCNEENIALTPYSALASGRLSRKVNETSTRLQQDKFAQSKYDATEEEDSIIINRVSEIAEKHNVSMTAVSLSWLLTKVTSPVVGATKVHHIDGAIEAINFKLTQDEIQYLEEPYIPHKLVGVMAMNH